MKMRFPARPPSLTVGTAVLVVMASVLSSAPTAGAQPPRPLNVKYTVWAERPFPVTIYYREIDPPNWAEYSHNPYVFSPKAKADVGPDAQWILDVTLADPEQWAMVTATSGPSTQAPNIHCVLAVDGVVVATDAGPKGALCSIRSW